MALADNETNHKMSENFEEHCSVNESYLRELEMFNIKDFEDTEMFYGEMSASECVTKRSEAKSCVAKHCVMLSSQTCEKHPEENEITSPFKPFEVEMPVAHTTPSKHEPKPQLKKFTPRKIKACGRDLGCSTPKNKMKKASKETLTNVSMVCHLWSKSAGVILANQQLNDSDISKIIMFGGPGLLNLLPSNITVKSMRRFMVQSGVIGKNMLHDYKTDCKYFHCLLINEYAVKNDIDMSSEEKIQKFAESPKFKKALSNISMIQQNSEHPIDNSSSKYCCPAPDCSHSNTRRGALAKHILKNHPGEEYDLKSVKIAKPRLVKCDICGSEVGIRYLSNHKISCRFSKNFPLQDNVPQEKDGFCTECRQPKTKLREHKKRVHKYDDCKFCLVDLGPPCLSCRVPSCKKCSVIPQWCPSCTIDPSNKCLGKKSFDLIEDLCFMCKVGGGKRCQSCGNYVCQTCEKYPGHCKSCVLILDSDRQTMDRHLSFDCIHGYSDKALKYTREFQLNDDESEVLKGLLSSTKSFDQTIISKLKHKVEEKNSSEVILNLMEAYHKRDLIPGRFVEDCNSCSLSLKEANLTCTIKPIII